MDVTINGVSYSPNAYKIGIAITTHDRQDVLIDSIKQHKKYLPAGATLVVIDDGSKEEIVLSEDIKVIRYQKSKGIVAAKNASLEALMIAGCDHLFLWDDDAYPIAENWHIPYINSPELHLSYQFLDLAGENKLNDIAILYKDNKHIAYTGQRGVMLYYHRSVIEKIGGFDPVYGRGMYEHADLAMRIYHAGLTTWAYADIAGSDKLIYSLDEHEKVMRSVPRVERELLVHSNIGTYNLRREEGYTAYVDYRTPKDIVITTLLTSQPDPQRGKKIDADARLLIDWAKSVKGQGVVLADELVDVSKGIDLVRVNDIKMNVYFRRWFHIYQYLRDHPEFRFVWCTDGTDVVMLRSPFDEMEHDKVYVGSEAKTYHDVWMINHHPEKIYQDFINDHKNDIMLNAGLLGGTRENVMLFAHKILQIYYKVESYRFWQKEGDQRAVGDMVAFGMVAKSFGNKIVTGAKVHTVFKTEGFGKEYAWWQHK